MGAITITLVGRGRSLPSVTKRIVRVVVALRSGRVHHNARRTEVVVEVEKEITTIINHRNPLTPSVDEITHDSI